jgi:ferric-dicitrate binding protein FerR (iron transport regulator)
VFDVQRDTHGDTLTVISGRVRVWNASQAWLGKMKSFIGSSPISGNAVADLTAGERIQLSASSIGAIQPATIAQTTAWLPDEIRFQHETVGNVARRFNAYTTTPLVIEDAHIAGLRISGVFHPDNPEGFVAYLASLPGVRVMRGDDRVRIVTSAADDHAATHRL